MTTMSVLLTGGRNRLQQTEKGYWGFKVLCVCPFRHPRVLKTEGLLSKDSHRRDFVNGLLDKAPVL